MKIPIPTTNIIKWDIGTETTLNKYLYLCDTLLKRTVDSTYGILFIIVDCIRMGSWDEWVKESRCAKYLNALNRMKQEAFDKSVLEEARSNKNSKEKTDHGIKDDTETANKVNKRHVVETERGTETIFDLDDLQQQNEEMKEMNENHNKLQTEYDQMNDVVRLYEGNHVELKLQNGWNRFDVKFKCVERLDRTKNIVVDGCGHVTLCQRNQIVSFVPETAHK
eukprot:112849_1